ncbi:class II aldolase/adducin family protein [Streptomyces sp. TLI_105]|uniref:class II aldolase/adducin family protein n=1 Tax=Streptomyces sp. TLI_105 TaxID=1881019 RepID=UPI00210960B7|nr:class II aldolase/adducin family protein [Streptomyces sp. TLI_105]
MFRLFGQLGFSEGGVGHITARDPGNPDWSWGNPFGRSFSRIRVSGLVLVDHAGNVVEGRHAVDRAAFCIHSRRACPRVPRSRSGGCCRALPRRARLPRRREPRGLWWRLRLRLRRRPCMRPLSGPCGGGVSR